jgi:hypothetical protein
MQELVSAFAAVRAELTVRPRSDVLPELCGGGQARRELFLGIQRVVRAADLHAQKILDKRWADIERFAEAFLQKGTVNIPGDFQV